MIFQNGTSSWGGTRKLPNVFTEQGVAMLSGVLNSDRAIAVHIQIIRVFTKMRSMLLTQKNLLTKVEEIEKRVGNQDNRIQEVFEYLKQLVKEQNQPRVQPRVQIGFKRKKNKGID